MSDTIQSFLTFVYVDYSLWKGVVCKTAENVFPADIRMVFHCYMLSVKSHSVGQSVAEFPIYSETAAMERLSGVSGRGG